VDKITKSVTDTSWEQHQLRHPYIA